MATWRDVERVRREQPGLTCAEIASVLGCMPQYVSATFRRRGWHTFRRFSMKAVGIYIPLADLEAVRLPDEAEAMAAQRIVKAGLAALRGGA